MSRYTVVSNAEICGQERWRVEGRDWYMVVVALIAHDL
jgi:hypothetical protein